ncbi:hypothetical protein, partial [Streptomyces microflavus]
MRGREPNDAPVEPALAGLALDDDRSAGWTKRAGHWARQYLVSDNLGTLGLGDVLVCPRCGRAPANR